MAKRGAKRKPELDLEATERSSYASFVAAANAVSQLYTAGVREQRRTAKATLEKVLTFVLREHPNSEYIPKAALLQFLQHEYERADHPDTIVPPGAPGLMPFMLSAASAASSGDEGPDAERLVGSGGKLQRAGSGRGRASAGLVGDADAHHPQQHQFMQQQAAHFAPQGPAEQQQTVAFQQQAAAYQQQQQQQPFMQQPYHQQGFPQQQQAHPGNAMDTNQVHQHSFPPHFG